jgi:hypothetical protein
MADQSTPKNKAKEFAATAGQAASAATERAKETASTIANKAGEAASNIGHKAQNLASAAAVRADETLSSVGQGVSSLAGTLRHNAPQEGVLGSAAGYVADTLQGAGGYLQELRVEDMGEDIRGFVREYPLGSLLAVFGLGLLMGRTLGR